MDGHPALAHDARERPEHGEPVIPMASHLAPGERHLAAHDEPVRPFLGVGPHGAEQLHHRGDAVTLFHAHLRCATDNGGTRGEGTEEPHERKLIHHRGHLGGGDLGGVQERSTSHDDVARGLAGDIGTRLHDDLGAHALEHAEKARAPRVEVDTRHPHGGITPQYTGHDGECSGREVARHADVGEREAAHRAAEVWARARTTTVKLAALSAFGRQASSVTTLADLRIENCDIEWAIALVERSCAYWTPMIEDSGSQGDPDVEALIRYARRKTATSDASSVTLREFMLSSKSGGRVKVTAERAKRAIRAAAEAGLLDFVEDGRRSVRYWVVEDL